VREEGGNERHVVHKGGERLDGVGTDVVELGDELLGRLVRRNHDVSGQALPGESRREERKAGNGPCRRWSPC
jgi:hypothetical protein